MTANEVTHLAAPWSFGVRNAKERGDGSTWGAKGLWSAHNELILGTGDGWSAEYQGPDEAHAALIVAAPEGLAEAKKTYIFLLRLPMAIRSKMECQERLCGLRDFIAKATNRSAQDVQDEFDAKATEGRAK